MRTLDFNDHRRSLDDNHYVYAVVSRRVGGLSIGINLNPDKTCNFSCPYCQVDRTIPGGARRVDLDRLAGELDGLLGFVSDGTLWDRAPFNTAASHLRRVGDISFAGDGEPTAAREFTESVARVVDVRARHDLNGVRLSLLTNATLFHRTEVQAGLDALDSAGGQVWAKLDAGSQEWFERVDGTQLSLDRVMDNILMAAQRYRVVIQSMFHAFEDEGPSNEEIAAWVDRLSMVIAAGGTIEEVQVYTVARTPADASVKALTVERLDWIANQAQAAGLNAHVY